MSVRAVLFTRKEVKRLGIAPMSSMFWFGENSRRRFDDFRPEVHDSDGLAIRMGTGERIWRPICNDTGNLQFSFFNMAKCDGFGLLQRDRRFAAYEDGEAAYDLRPSLWIEPTSDWGAGSVMLMEIPTGNELADNTVAMWVPEKSPKPGDRLEFQYRQHWTMETDPSEAGGHLVATRTGTHEWQPEQRTMIVEFEGTNLTGKDGAMPEALVEAGGDAAEKVRIQRIAVQPISDGRIRLGFQILPAEEGGKLADIGAVELRAALKREGVFAAVVDPYVNGVHVSLLEHCEMNPVEEALAKRCLKEGTEALSKSELSQLLYLTPAMLMMHRTVWLGLSDDVGPLWMRAVESYRRRGELAGD